MPAIQTIPDSDSYNWIIVPATRCIQTVAEGAKLSGLFQRAVTALANQEPMLIRLEALLTAMGAGSSLADGPALTDSMWTEWSNELLRNDLHEVHVPGIIALWASLEVTVEDTATLILLNDPQAQTDAVAAGVKIPSKCPTPLDEFNARRIFSRLEQVSRETRSIALAYAQVLKTLGVGISLGEDVFEVLAELNYVRNCILHRGGIFDSRVIVEAPKSGFSVGDAVHVAQKDYLRYFGAVSAFAHEILNGAIASRHARWRASET